MFESSINLDVVRIVEAAVANAPTTLGNVIRVSSMGAISNWEVRQQAMSTDEGRQRLQNRLFQWQTTLIHELAHVWQFQTKGTSYITDSLWHQTRAMVETGDRNAAYVVTDKDLRGKSIHDLPAEKQAMVVENYFSDPSKGSNDDYQRMIGEVRSARPLARSLIWEETLLGPGGSNQRLFPLAPGDDQQPVAPLFRLEFDLL